MLTIDAEHVMNAAAQRRLAAACRGRSARSSPPAPRCPASCETRRGARCAEVHRLPQQLLDARALQQRETRPPRTPPAPHRGPSASGRSQTPSTPSRSGDDRYSVCDTRSVRPCSSIALRCDTYANGSTVQAISAADTDGSAAEHKRRLTRHPAHRREQSVLRQEIERLPVLPSVRHVDVQRAAVDAARRAPVEIRADPAGNS